MTRILAAALVLSLATGANAATLTFEELGLNSSEAIPETYGDLANLDLSYKAREGFGNTGETHPYLLYWEQGYSDRTGVAYAPYESVAEISFNAAAGYVGKITSLYFGVYTSDVNGSFAIYDSDWNVLWSHTENSIWDGGIALTPNVSFTGLAYLQWGNDWNLGLDRLDYSVEIAGTQPAPVPLPAGLPLLGAGLLAFGGMRMRQRRG